MPATPHHVDDLVPHPFSLEQFRLAAERRTGRPLALEPAPLAGAMLITTRDTDLIIYNQRANAGQQLQLIGHEAAHLLLGHQPRERPSPFTHLDPAAVAETVTFHGYSQADEQEADDFARLLAQAKLTTSTSK
jgi:sortase (surface protein transpeptidase)